MFMIGTGMPSCTDKIPIELMEPIEGPHGVTHWINVSCGRCASCIMRRKMEWGFRMEYEMKRAKTWYFVTLTYDDANLPYTDKGYWTLDQGDLTKFFKRLRRHSERSGMTRERVYNNLLPSDKIKYFACGEYGEARKRPHYHAIIFNASEKDIFKSWKKGLVHVVPANSNTIAYVMKYLDKGLGKKKPKHKVPEFHTMSEGIGDGYVDDFKRFHKQNLDLQFVTNHKGIRCPMPKYYRDKIFNDTERKEIVKLVHTVLEDDRLSEIERIGMAAYNNKQSQIIKYRDTKIKKSAKRIID